MNAFFKFMLLGFAILVIWRLWSLRNAEPSPEDKAAAKAIAAAFEARRAEAMRPATPVYRDKDGKIIKKYEYELMTGYDTAKERGLASHDDCGKMQELVRKGCDRYVTERRVPPHIDQGDYSSGKTSAQCEAEVSIHFDARIQDLREMGFRPGDSFLTEMHQDRYQELKQCRRYDTVAASRVEPTP